MYATAMQVSLYGHSLGSVLSYDILCHQECSYAPFPLDTANLKGTNAPEKEAKFVASYQSTKSIVSMKSENNITEDGAALEPLAHGTVDDRSFSHIHVSVNQGEIEDHSCTRDQSFTKDLQEVYSDNDGTFTEEEFDDLDLLYSKEKHAQTSFLKQAEEKLKVTDDETFCTEGKGATGYLNSVVDYKDSVVDVVCHNEIVNKDKTISQLEEEVRILVYY